ncbi:MAG: hypothetical protein HY868_27510 [Chloroflexi bacterium]|nr:hypothetical protein [Chloroflexota bacterium]
MSFLSSLFDLLARLFNPSPPPPPPPPIPPEAGELTPLAPRVLMITYNPTVNPATGKKLIQELNWNDPETLAQGYITDLRESSGGLVNYQIVERIEVDEFPKKESGFVYDPQQFVSAYRAGGAGLDPGMVDYQAILAKFNILARVANNEIDEVWIWNFPGAGFYESTMGGKGAFFCNSNPLPNTETCPRRFVVMGFSFERGNGEMLENLGHRAESMLARKFHVEGFVAKTYNAAERTPALGASARNVFERFLLFDLIAPGQSNIGTIHYAPNSPADYEWGVMSPVQSCCDDWLLYPALPNPPVFRTVDAREWGSGDIREHHKWWLRHLPKVAGVTSGIANNWWKYIADPNQVK